VELYLHSHTFKWHGACIHCFELNAISKIKSRRMRWMRHDTHMEDLEMHTKCWLRNLKEVTTWECKCKQEDNIKLDLMEMVCEDVD
jgi:hypothetical protein